MNLKKANYINFTANDYKFKTLLVISFAIVAFVKKISTRKKSENLTPKIW